MTQVASRPPATNPRTARRDGAEAHQQAADDDHHEARYGGQAFPAEDLGGRQTLEGRHAHHLEIGRGGVGDGEGVRRGQDSSGDGSAQHDAQGEGQIPQPCRLPIVSEEVVSGREHRCADMPQVLGHPELAPSPEEQGDHKSNEGAGHIPRPGFREQLEHRIP